MNIKTLTLKQFSDADLHFCAEDIQIPLLELIQNREENSLLSAIQNYQPYLDIIREPLLTLFLTGYNHITFNIDFTIQINPITSKGKMIILLKAPYLMSADIVIDLKNLPPDFINSLLSSFLKNAPLPLSDKIVQEITLTTKDNGFIKNYHQFTNYLIPEKVQQAQHHNKAIYAYFKEQKGSLRLDYETLSWVLKSAFYKREKSNK